MAITPTKDEIQKLIEHVTKVAKTQLTRYRNPTADGDYDDAGQELFYI